MTISKDHVVHLARGFLGVKWKHQGRTSEHGIDCVGLPVMVGQLMNLWEPIPAQYPRRPDGTFVKNFREHLVFVRPSDRQDGDVLVFSEGGHPCHCGISSTMNNEPSVIHSHAGMRKVVEQTLDSALPLIGKPVFTFRYPGVE